MFCTSKRQNGVWEEKGVAMRTFGRLEEKYQGWKVKSSLTTASTSKAESCVDPVLVRTEADTDDTTILMKVGMPSVHLLLGLNSILRPHMTRFFGGEDILMKLLRTELGVVPHL